MIEAWLPVPGWEGIYEVSDLGRVRSIDRVARHKVKPPQKISGRMLSPIINTNGYPSVGLRRGKKYKKNVPVHRLVAMAFVPNPEGKPAVNHIDCDKTNNRTDNLEWCTQLENLAHMTALGRRAAFWRGKRSPNAALSDEMVRAIRDEYAAGGLSYGGISSRYGLSKRAVARLINLETYSDVL